MTDISETVKRGRGQPRREGEGSYYYRAPEEYRDYMKQKATDFYIKHKEELNQERTKEYKCEKCGAVMCYNTRYIHEKDGRCERKLERQAKREQKAQEREEKIKAGLLKPRNRKSKPKKET